MDLSYHPPPLVDVGDPRALEHNQIINSIKNQISVYRSSQNKSLPRQTIFQDYSGGGTPVKLITSRRITPEARTRCLTSCSEANNGLCSATPNNAYEDKKKSKRGGPTCSPNSSFPTSSYRKFVNL